MKNLCGYFESILDEISDISVIVEDNKPTIIRQIDNYNNESMAAHIAWNFQKRRDEVYSIMELYGFNKGDFNYREDKINLPEGWRVKK